MKLDRLTPMLWTNDLKATLDFYQTVLGFELDEYNEGWGWCHLHRNSVNIMFTRPIDHSFYIDKPTLTGSLYLYTEEVDELWEKLKDHSNISYGIANFEHHMREFAILDNNGYMLQFGRELREGEIVTACE
jgi:uncharacterized glyoxalase superfamily protein PhnB